MRIAHYAPLDFTTKGGVQTSVVSLSRAMLRLGHEVEVVALRPDPSAGVPTIPKEAFHRERYDVVNSHAHLCFWSSPARRGVRCHVHTLRGTTLGLRLACRRLRAAANPRNWLGVLSEWRAAHESDRVIALGSAVREEAVRLYRVSRAKMTIVPNGQWTTGVPPTPAARQQWRQRLGLTDKEIVFLFVGRDSDYVKNAPRLVAAYADARLRRRQIRLVMVPGGAQAPAEVVRTGPLGQGELSGLYHAADAVAVVSRYESFCNVLVESMGAGLPCLTTPVGAAPDLIVTGQNGVLLAPDARDLSDWMVRLVDAPAWRRSLGTRAKETVQHLTWDRIAEQTLAVYERALREASP
jgi:glycosyltransferase involved in cell wall biosynthesis